MKSMLCWFNLAHSVHQTALLYEFRAAHPYRQLDFDGWSWRYLFTGNGRRVLLLLPGDLVGRIEDRVLASVGFSSPALVQRNFQEQR